MQRDKTERRKSELKSKSCPVLSRQSLARRGHEEVPQRHVGTAGMWVPSKEHKGGTSIFFLQKEQIMLPAQLLKKSFYFYKCLVWAAVLLKAFSHLQPSKCPCLRTGQRCLPRGLRGRQPLNAQSVVWLGTLMAGSDAASTELCSPGGLVRSGLTCQGFCVLHKFRTSQPGCAGERSGEHKARAVWEGIHLILGSAWPSAGSDGTPGEFVHSCAPSPKLPHF